MKGLGIALAITGVLVALLSLAMDTTVTTDPVVSSLTDLPSLPSQVYNMGLVEHQLMVFLTGLALAIAGVVIAAAGAVIEALAPPKEPATPSPIAADAPAAASMPAPDPDDGAATITPETEKLFIWGAVGIGAFVMLVIIAIWLAQQAEYHAPVNTADYNETLAEDLPMTDNIGAVPTMSPTAPTR